MKKSISESSRLNRFVAVLLSILVAASAPVSAQPKAVIEIPLMAYYDLDSTSDIACSYGIETTAQGRAVTSGSNTTTTSTTSVFDSIIAGDIIWATISGVSTGRVISAKASANSVTVDSAWNLGTAGVGIRYQRQTCAAAGGWVDVDGADLFTISMNIAQMNVATGAVGFKIEGQFHSPQSLSTVVRNLWPGNSSTDAKCNAGTYSSGYCTYTSATNSGVTFSSMGLVFPQKVRLVAILTGTDDGSDVGAAGELIHATLAVVR